MKNTNTRRASSVHEPDAMHAYMREIKRYPLLTAEEERELSEHIQKGDRQALEKLICSNLRFVTWMARQFYPKTLTLMDLVEEGNIGLIHAASTYRYVEGARFASYAREHIRSAICLALSEKDSMLTRHDRGFRYDTQVRRYVRQVEQCECRQPSAEEVAEATHLPLQDVVTILYSTTHTKDIDDVDACNDREAVEQSIDHEDDCFRAAQYLSALDDEERLITEHLYGLGDRKQLDAKELATHLDIPYSRVRKVAATAMKKMAEMAERNENEKK